MKYSGIGFVLTVLVNTCFAKGLDVKASHRADEETERRETCMGELGCFQNTEPFDQPSSERIISVLPDDRTEIGTEFRFSAPGRTTTQYITNSNFSSWDIANSGLKPKAKTKFITHGFLGGNAEWAVTLKDAMMKKEECNVFIVDWTNGHGPIYEQAVANIRVVGAEIGAFILKLVDAVKLDTSKVHLIGHSLGSHASGYAGKFVQSKDKSKKVGRITGLDPAGPYFNDVSPVVRLARSDAAFVDVIHTNWAEHRLSGFGLFEAIGHFDFYPNGGEDQPGCPTASEASAGIVTEVLPYISPIGAIIKLATGSKVEDITDRVNDLSCSHGRAYEYFIASIEDKDCEFRAVQCFSWERFLSGECGSCKDHMCYVMGYYADRYKRSIGTMASKKYYLRTTSSYPFCVEKNEPKLVDIV